MAGKGSAWRKSVGVLARRHGLNATMERGGHMKLRNAEGKTVVTCSASPSDSQRALKNVEQTIKYALRHIPETASAD